MRKINLLSGAPQTKRRFDPEWRTDENRKIARRFDKDFFDGDRVNGYGGYTYDGRWRQVAKKLQTLYDLDGSGAFLDVGCAKGFLLYDLIQEFPGISVAGIDVSDYAIRNAMGGYGEYARREGRQEDFAELEKTARKIVSPYMVVGSADDLPYKDDTFDVVISINTLHNLPRDRCEKAIKEIIRVCKDNKMFIQVDSYENREQQETLRAWNLTAKTILPPKGWLDLFREAGYDGNYFWTLINPE